jgi:hypothetical protein
MEHCELCDVEPYPAVQLVHLWPVAAEGKSVGKRQSWDTKKGDVLEFEY